MGTEGTQGGSGVARLAHLGVRVHATLGRLEQAMTAVVGYAQLASDLPCRDPAGRRAIARLLDATRGTKGLLDELARTVGRDRHAGASCVPLRTVVERAAREVTAALGTDAAVVDRHADTPVWVLGEPDALERLIAGLLITGAEAIGRAGRLTVQTLAPLPSDHDASIARLALVAVPASGARRGPSLLRDGSPPAPPAWIAQCLAECRAHIGAWRQDASGLDVEILLPGVTGRADAEA